MRVRSAAVAMLTAILVGVLAACPDGTVPDRPESVATPDEVVVPDLPAGRYVPGGPGTVYVAVTQTRGKARGTLAALDPSGARVRTVSLGKIASELVLAPRGTQDEGDVYATAADSDGDAFLAIDPLAGRSREVPVDGQMSPLVVAPAGSPQAGTVYVSTLDNGQLFTIAPGSRTAQELPVTPVATYVAVAPEGTPNAGAVVVSDRPNRLVSVLRPGEIRPFARARLPNRAGFIAIAPAGTPRAGTVYAVVDDWEGAGPGRVAVLPPEGSPFRYLTVGKAPYRVFVTPSGLPGAGTIHVLDGKTLWSLDPESEKPNGRVFLPTGVRELAIAPPGVPGAGTLYMVGSPDGLDGLLMILEPGSSIVRTIPIKNNPAHVAVAPDGTPAEGTVYITTVLGGALSIVAPGGDSLKSVQLGDFAEGIAIVPAG